MDSKLKEYNFGEIIGKSEVLEYILFRIKQVAPTDTTVMLQGETGTGKDQFARAIHRLSLRKDRPLVKVDCASLPAYIIESELFGHEKGAYTGAYTKQVGRFELANKGTILLDEIGELPLELQPKMLRVLQEGEFERLGNPKTIKVDVRVIAATNRNLKEEIQKGRFRQDLFYRLNIFPLTIPPLRERKEDIPLLARWFVKRISKKLGKKIGRIPPKTMKALQDYSWPGNVRELESMIERSIIIAQNTTLRVDLPGESDYVDTYGIKTIKEVERDYFLKILNITRWKIAGPGGAAELLGIHPNTLRSRMQKHGLKKP
ncbi:sigma-54 interaction domain-containing protein [Thermodesulfobacteriota bacterium]